LKIYIVTAYKNRKQQLYQTLNSISRSKLSKDKYEVIIVDDASDEQERLDEIIELFDYQIKVIRIEEHEKFWNNPCMTFNIGFSIIDHLELNSKVIIQNPECYHNGDVIKYVDKNLNNKNYLAFNCLSLSKSDSKNINNKKYINKLLCSTYLGAGQSSPENDSLWYNHPIYRNRPYHFCTAITYSNLKKLNGFDLNYSDGHSYDDDEFLHRIMLMNLEIINVKTPNVLHQFHELFTKDFDQLDLTLVEKNKLLYNNLVLNNGPIRCNKSNLFGLL